MDQFNSIGGIKKIIIIGDGAIAEIDAHSPPAR